MIFDSQHGAFAVFGVAAMIAVGEPRLDFSQIAQPDWLAAQRAERLQAGRPAIHYLMWCLLCTESSSRGLLASKPYDSDGNCLSRSLKTEQPSAVGLLARLGAIDALL